MSVALGDDTQAVVVDVPKAVGLAGGLVVIKWRALQAGMKLSRA